MRPTQLGILFSLLLLTATALKAESEEDRAALARFLADPAERLDLLTRVHQQASELNLPPELVLSVIEVESTFDRFAVSRAGA